jgi:putative aldouronate transport system permease protein
MNTRSGSWKDKTFDILNVVFMVVLAFITLYPFWNALVGSFNNGTDYMRGGVAWFPRVWTIDNYRVVFLDSSILNAFKITIARTVLATFAHVIFTGLFAYGFSKKQLIGRSAIAVMGMITMLFFGGLIPYYMVIKSLGFINNFLVYIIPGGLATYSGLFSFFEVLIFQAYFREIPDSLVESAKLDGANEYTIFFKIILPVSAPVVAAVTLFCGIYNWNAYFDSMLFTTKPELQTVMMFLMKIVKTQQAASSLARRAATILGNRTTTSRTVQLATMMVTTIPIIMVYPFMQRYFVKGVMIGSVKG